MMKRINQVTYLIRSDSGRVKEKIGINQVTYLIRYDSGRVKEKIGPVDKLKLKSRSVDVQPVTVQ